MKRIGRQLGRAALLLFLLLSVLAGAAFVFLQTTTGRQFLVSQIEGAVHDDAGLSLKLGTLSGNIFSDFQIASLTLKDTEGVWLAAQDIKASWSPFALLSGTARVEAVSVASIDIHRQPILPAAAEDAPSGSLFPLPLRPSLASLKLDRVMVAEALLGQQAILGVSLTLNTPKETLLQSALKIVPLDNQGGAVTGTVDYDIRSTRLGIVAELEGPEGGFISRLLGLPNYSALSASVVGEGPLTSWQGQVTAHVDEIFAGDMLILTKGDDVIDIEMSGGGGLSSQIASSLPLVDDDRIALVATLSVDLENENVRLQSAVIENDALYLEAKGQLDFQSLDLAGDMQTVVKDVASLNALITPATIGALRANVAVKGTLEKAHVKATARSETVALKTEEAVPPVMAKTALVEGTSTLSLTDLAILPFEGSLTLSGLSNLPPAIQGTVGAALTLDMEGRYTLSEGALDIAQMHLQAEKAQAEGTAQLTPGAGPSGGTLTVKLDDIGTLAKGLKGKAIGTAVFKSSDITQGGEGQLDLNVTGFNMGNTQIQPLLGSDLRLGAAVSFRQDMLVISDVTVPLATARITGAAKIPAPFETITATVNAALPKLDPLSDLAGVKLAGDMLLTTDISGALADPAVLVDVAIQSLTVDSQSVGEVRASLTAEDSLSSPNGTLEGEFVAPHIDTDFTIPYALVDQVRLQMEGISIAQNDNTLTGSLSVPLDGTPAAGSLVIDFPDLTRLAAAGDLQMRGSVSGALGLEDAAGTQSLVLDLTGKQISVEEEDLRIKAVQMALNAEDVLNDPRFEMNAEIADVAQGDVRIETIKLTGSGTTASADLGFEMASGTAPVLDLSGAATAQISDAATLLTIKALKGRFSEKELALQNRFTVQKSGDDVTVEAFTLAFGRGQVTASASLLEEQANADVAIENFPLDLVNLLQPDRPVSGDVSGQAVFQVTSQSSTGTVSLNTRNVVLTGPDFEDLPPISSQLEGRLADGQLSFTGQVSGLPETQLQTSGAVPVITALSPLVLELPEDQPIEMQLDATSNLDKIWPLLGLDRHLLTGSLTAKGSVSGTLAQPAIEGGVRLTGGRYEEIELGTILEDLNVSVLAEKNGKVEVTAAAIDGDSGSLSASGRLDFADLSNPGLDMVLKLQEMALLRQDTISATTNADLTFTGTQQSLAIRGDIETRQVEVNIGGSLAPGVVEIPVTEINFPKENGSDANALTPKKRQIVSLAVDVNLPQQVFIRGRGLDSEWEGKLSVTGTAAAPVLKGYLSPVRGQFSFSGKDFVLQKGTIRLTGEADIDPELSLSAKYDSKNVTAIVAIEGTASNPKITFSSPDNLPEDEVLSRVLFGKSAAKLSALEALQLAQAVANVSGQLGSGGGVLDYARQTLGVDTLSAGVNSETGEAEVAAGKYITDNIYVGVAQGATAGSTKARVEIEVTPNLSIESETDQTTDSRVGVFWKWDY
ncbi:MAG: translocation/assembly module TamB domain-containing protein [Sneathiella sp.]